MKNPWIGLIVVLAMCCLWGITAILGWKTSEKQLGEPLIPESSQILDSKQIPYFISTSSITLRSGPSINAGEIAVLEKKSVFYAYAQQGNWLRVKLVKSTGPKDLSEIVGWVSKSKLVQATNQERFFASTLPYIQASFSLKTVWLFLLEVSLLVSSLKLFRGNNTIFGIILGSLFFAITIFDLATVTRQDVGYKVLDVEFFNISMFRIMLIIILSIITDQFTRLLASSSHVDSNLLNQIKGFTILGIVAGVLFSVVYALKMANVKILNVEDPHPGVLGDNANFFCIDATKWFMISTIGLFLISGIIHFFKNRVTVGKAFEQTFLLCFFSLMFVHFISATILNVLLGFSFASSFFVGSVFWAGYALFFLYGEIALTSTYD